MSQFYKQLSTPLQIISFILRQKAEAQLYLESRSNHQLDLDTELGAKQRPSSSSSTRGCCCGTVAELAASPAWAVGGDGDGTWARHTRRDDDNSHWAQLLVKVGRKASSDK